MPLGRSFAGDPVPLDGFEFCLEFLKIQSKRGESDLLEALDELEKARKENEFLRAKFRELQTENQKLRRALLAPR